MTVSSVTEGGDALSRARRENETLYAVIKTVSSSLALDRVLGGIVEIATDATDFATSTGERIGSFITNVANRIFEVTAPIAGTSVKGSMKGLSSRKPRSPVSVYGYELSDSAG